MKKILIAGAGGHGRAVAEAIVLRGQYEIAGFLDDFHPERSLVWEFPILGTMQDMERFAVMADSIVVAIGNNRIRRTIFGRAKALGFTLPAIIHPTAFVSPRAIVGEGCCIMAHAVVGTEAVLGRGCVVNVNATADHHCRLDDFAHLGTGVQLAGGVKVGEAAWMQVGSSAGYGVEVPAGAVVLPGVGLTTES
jgi:sugar O-acyltransferase (sialic acid O-acetyltransferase NeuD family)